MKPGSPVLLLCALGMAVGLASAHARSNETDTQTARADAASIEGAACKRMLERFVVELDAAMAAEYGAIHRYTNVLATHLNSAWGQPLGPPDASTMGCKMDQVVEVARRSQFFFAADGPPRHAIT
jgi:hypothetical protein